MRPSTGAGREKEQPSELTKASQLRAIVHMVDQPTPTCMYTCGCFIRSAVAVPVHLYSKGRSVRKAKLKLSRRIQHNKFRHQLGAR